MDLLLIIGKVSYVTFLLSYFVFPLNNETSGSWGSTYQHKGPTSVTGMMKLFFFILSNKIKSPHTVKLRSKSILNAMNITFNDYFDTM